jgi:AraC-like DNA-binding protein
MTDVLSSVLSLVRASGSISGRLRAGGDWALRLPPPENPKFNAVVNGGCWLTSAALEEPIWLAEGDSVLLVDSCSYVLSSAPQLAPEDAGRSFAEAVDGVATAGTGEGTFLIGGQIELAAIAAPLLLDQLPPVVIVRSDDPGSADLRWALTTLVRELGSDRPGQCLLSEHLAQMIIVLIIRAHYASGGAHLPGWLRALADPRVARPIRAVHGDPARDWTVGNLAGEAGMSRSSFAELFAGLVGRTPMAYVAEWRLQLVASRLEAEVTPIGAIAADSGYSSESALGAAFRRRFGTTPASHRRNAWTKAPVASADGPVKRTGESPRRPMIPV